MVEVCEISTRHGIGRWVFKSFRSHSFIPHLIEHLPEAGLCVRGCYVSLDPEF